MTGFRCSSRRFVIATIITMTLCGLWHGASWNFVLWGFYFGVALTINHYFKLWREQTGILKNFFASKYFHALSIFLTFQTFCLGAVIFRIKDLRSDLYLVKKMLLLSPIHGTLESGQYLLLRHELPLAVPLGLLLVIALLILNAPISKLKESGYITRLPVPLKATYLAILLFAMLIFVPSTSTPFIYFQF